MSMDDFSVYAVMGINDAPRKLLSIDKEKSSSVAVPPHVRQVVVFSHGRWGEHPGVIVALNQTEGKTIRLEKLTTSTKCLFWECSGEDERNNGLTLTVTLEGVVKGEFADGDCAQLVHSKKECTPKDSAAPPSAWETHGKRKRGQEEEIEEDTKGQENVCPNDSPSDRVTPNRRARGRPRSGQKRLFARGEDAANARVPQSSKAKGKQAKTPGTGSLVSPSGRWGHTLCPIDSKTAILIGGQGSRIQFCKDPIWKLCTEDMSWVAAETLAEGPTPEVRIGHTATFDPESKRIFVFGGSKNKKWFNDVHILDSQSWRWSTVEAQGKVPPLAYHSCSLFRGELFVLGGVFPRPHPEPDGCSDSLYIFNPEMAIWYQPIVNGDRPAPRSGHSACVLQGKIFMFGGWDTPVCFNDMHALDLGLMEFLAVETTGQPPSPRSWHGCAALSNSRFLLHGGYNGTSALSDTFVFDTDSSSWTMVVNSHLSAVPRAGHTIITMANTSAQDLAEDEDPGLRPLAQTLLIFGGGDNEGSFFSDLITLPIAELV